MKISEFLSENCHVLVVKISVYLNRLVFVMPSLQDPIGWASLNLKTPLDQDHGISSSNL